MKKYIKPVAELYDVRFSGNLLDGSGVDPEYVEGDPLAKRRGYVWDEDEEDNTLW